jgi:outer membrane lipoprotein-sorting protein
MKKRLLVTAFGIGIALSAASVVAATQFSADTVQTTAQGQQTTGKIFVGDKRVRTEGSQNGEQFVQISDNANNISYMIMPAQRSYIEIKLPGSAPMPQGKAADPCANLEGVTCRNAGTENVAGRAATRWEMSSSAGGQARTMTQWVDDERGMPLRVQSSDGSVSESKLVAKEQVEGRTVEKWETTISRPGQQTLRSVQWLDRELAVPVRGEGPDGSTFALRNIQVGPQPGELFTVPAGYQKLTVPQGQPGGAPAGR